MTRQTAVALTPFPVKVFYTGYNLVTGSRGTSTGR